MKRGKLTDRLAELPFLLAERPYSQQELADYFTVDRKTIQRNIQALSFNYPIVEERRGRQVYYLYSDGYRFRAPQFTPAELATLLLAQQAIASAGLTAFSSPFAEHARTLLTKVRASLPEQLRARLELLAQVYGAATVPAKDFAAYSDVIERLTTAAVEQWRVQMRYYTMSSNTVSERLYEPYAIYFDPDGATLKVIGYDHKSGEIRPFSIDHIHSLRLTREHFTRPTDFTLPEYLSAHCFNGIHGELVTVRLRATGVTARIFAERRFHSSQRLINEEPPVADATTIEMRVAGGRGLLRFVLSWLPDVEVLSPPELRAAVENLLRQSLTLAKEK